ncbi:MAG: HD domain-containing protein [Elusimicrobia bacterium]|nr:HD domain-containing protein [Elusimicrobiota bacterium]
MKNPPLPPRLTKEFSDAFEYAWAAHGRDARKGTSIPYLSHPMAVASLVLEYGGSEIQAIAALLHDTVEDCEVPLEALERRFGKAVARIVADCTDSQTTPKPPWKDRKLKYIAHARKKSRPESLLVSAADKLHNARAIVRDIGRHGPSVWKRFNALPDQIVWYYQELTQVFRERSKEARPPLKLLVPDLDSVVRELAALATPEVCRAALRRKCKASGDEFARVLTKRGFQVPGPDEPEVSR